MFKRHLHRISMHVYSWANTGFSKRGGGGGGIRTRDTKSGVGGGGGGGGAVRFRPETKREGEGVLSALGPTRKAGVLSASGPIQKAVCVWGGGGQTYQVSRLRRESHASGFYLTLTRPTNVFSRLNSKTHRTKKVIAN